MVFNTSIVILEDNRDILDLYVELLSNIKNVAIQTFTNPREGLKFTIENKPDIVITDSIMPHMDGIHVAEKIREVYNPKIILAGAFVTKIVNNNQASYFDKCLNKPFDILELMNIVDIMTEDIVKKKTVILNKITSGFLEGINIVGKDKLFIENVVRTLMYDTDRPPDSSIYHILSQEMQKDESTIRKNICKSIEKSYEPTLFQKILGLNTKPKNKEFINVLLKKINEKAEEEKW